MVHIYGLIDPITKELRYIGKSNNINKRIKEHLKYSVLKLTHKDHWLYKLRESLLIPEIMIIEEVPNHCWNEHEIFWIEYFRFIGCRLTNATLGGEGFSITKEMRKKIAEAQTGEKSVWFGRKHTEETKLKMSIANTGRVMSEETRLKISSRLTKIKSSTTQPLAFHTQPPRLPYTPSNEIKRIISEKLTGIKRSPESIAKRLETKRLKRLNFKPWSNIATL